MPDIRSREVFGEGCLVGPAAGRFSDGTKLVGLEVIRGHKVPIHSFRIHQGQGGAIVATIPAESGRFAALDLSHPSGIWMTIPGNPDNVRALILYEAP